MILEKEISSLQTTFNDETISLKTTIQSLGK
jgi:hypothetical protein